ncbi:methyltransferase domain-containing protein [Streptomyces sp. NBC_00893]|uniref:methyltransferase domain-containing protein n=1 Tax=Streptomyces sp. NBC_00893 TaxID=2975862 RepID=UPI00225244C3|nr:methyltransferase domain-containing protein [Streptomyces sp. NBC_00893]MCX4844620.1 methyltransferase domain-containing protein [Streptomyces sp. NBC_00893]
MTTTTTSGASTPSGNVGEFTTVDSSDRSTWFIDFMDRANALPEYGDMRRGLAAALGDLKGKKVLEIGSGTGDDARGLAALVGDDGRVTGTDVSEAMVGEARRRSTEGPSLPVEFATEDMRRLSFADGHFDATTAKLVRQHCDDLDAADDELMRVTRRGGRLAIFDYDFDTLAVDHPDRTATRQAVHCFCDGHRNGWNGRALVGRFLDRGLNEVTVTPYTVRMPFAFFRPSLEGRLAEAQHSGELPWTQGQLADWWRPLIEAQERGRFFASLTGFVLGGTR